MRWQTGRRSGNVEDRRGRGGIGLPIGGRGGAVGCGGLILVLVISYFTGINPLQILGLLEGGGAMVGTTETGPVEGPPADDEEAQFVSVVLADTEDTWGALFAAEGSRYQAPSLVLFDDAVASACGYGSAAVGPFYCPADSKVYLDLSFFRELSGRFGAPGDFARAYVVAHEVGHHVQNLLGTNERVSRARQGASSGEANRLSVLLELQADCLAGVWGHHAGRRDLLDPGDVEEGLRAAAAIGDDVLQRSSGRAVQPESWTHGSAEQRVEWLRRGLDTGDVDVCDTFSAGG